MTLCLSIAVAATACQSINQNSCCNRNKILKKKTPFFLFIKKQFLIFIDVSRTLSALGRIIHDKGDVDLITILEFKKKRLGVTLIKMSCDAPIVTLQNQWEMASQRLLINKSSQVTNLLTSVRIVHKKRSDGDGSGGGVSGRIGGRFAATRTATDAATSGSG